MPEVGLPVREFLYTIDQLAFMLELTDGYVRNNLLHFEGRSAGVPSREVMLAINIAPSGKTPEWRVAERHLKRWMKFKGYRFYERGYLR